MKKFLKKIKKCWHRVKACPLVGVPYEKLIGYRRLEAYERKRREELQEVGIPLTSRICSALRQRSIYCFCAYGSLLGLIRDGHYLHHDNDIDIGVYIKNAADWDILCREMTKLGLHKIQEFSFRGLVMEQTYRRNRLTVDFFNYIERNDETVSYGFLRKADVCYADENDFTVREHHLPILSEICTMNFQGYDIPVPINYAVYLEGEYGVSWQIPDPNWIDGVSDTVQEIPDETAKKVAFDE